MPENAVVFEPFADLRQWRRVYLVEALASDSPVDNKIGFAKDAKVF